MLFYKPDNQTVGGRKSEILLFFFFNFWKTKKQQNECFSSFKCSHSFHGDLELLLLCEWLLEIKWKCTRLIIPGNKTAEGKASWLQASLCPDGTEATQTVQPKTHWKKEMQTYNSEWEDFGLETASVSHRASNSWQSTTLNSCYLPCKDTHTLSVHELDLYQYYMTEVEDVCV